MSKIYKKIEEAKILIEKKQFAKAITILNFCKKEYNKNWEVFFELGKIFFINRNFNMAVNNFKKAMALMKDNKYIKLLLAKSLKELNLNFNSLRLYFNIRQKNKDLKKEVDDDIISIFLKNELYFAILKYINKYNTNKDLFNKILDCFIVQISFLNFNGNSIKAKNLAKKALNKLKNLDIKSKNSLLNEIEIADNKVYLKSFPRILKVSITKDCNLSCRMCNFCIQKTPYGILTKTNLGILKLLFKYAELIEWQGGEPFLYKYFSYFLSLANKNKVKQNITSNGLLLNDDYIKQIVNYNIELTLSIDSVDEKIYEYIRVGSKFSILLKNIKKLYNYRKIKKWNNKFKLNAVLSRWNWYNKNNFIDIVEFANKYNFTDIDIYVDSSERDLKLKKEYIDNFNLNRENLINLANSYRINLNIQIPKSKLNSNLVTINKLNVNNLKDKYCLLPWKKIYINYNKVMSVDCHCPDIGILNSNTKNFFISDIWNGNKIVEFREKIVNNNLKNIENLCVISNYRYLRKG